MELDELKNSWNKLNEHLEKKDLIDERALENLIAQHKHDAGGKINKIAGLGKISVAIAVVGLLVMLIGFIVIPTLELPAEATKRIGSIGLFFCVILVLGGSWDLITYLWIKRTDIETLSVIKVIERINRFRQWVKYEVVALVVIFLTLIGIEYCMNEIYEKSPGSQIIFFVSSLFIIGIVTYVIYKKMLFDNLHDIRKNLEELQELEKD